MKIEELEKGCGKAIQFSPFYCGRLNNPVKPIRSYCSECKIRLTQAQEDKKKILEIIENLENEYNVWNNVGEKLRQADKIGALLDLKQKIEEEM